MTAWSPLNVLAGVALILLVAGLLALGVEFAVWMLFGGRKASPPGA